MTHFRVSGSSWLHVSACVSGSRQDELATDNYTGSYPEFRSTPEVLYRTLYLHKVHDLHAVEVYGRRSIETIKPDRSSRAGVTPHIPARIGDGQNLRFLESTLVQFATQSFVRNPRPFETSRGWQRAIDTGGRR